MTTSLRSEALRHTPLETRIVGIHNLQQAIDNVTRRSLCVSVIHSDQVQSHQAQSHCGPVLKCTTSTVDQCRSVSLPLRICVKVYHVHCAPVSMCIIPLWTGIKVHHFRCGQVSKCTLPLWAGVKVYRFHCGPLSQCTTSIVDQCPSVPRPSWTRAPIPGQSQPYHNETGVLYCVHS